MMTDSKRRLLCGRLIRPASCILIGLIPACMGTRNDEAHAHGLPQTWSARVVQVLVFLVPETSNKMTSCFDNDFR